MMGLFFASSWPSEEIEVELDGADGGKFLVLLDSQEGSLASSNPKLEIFSFFDFTVSEVFGESAPVSYVRNDSCESRWEFGEKRCEGFGGMFKS